MTTRCRAVCLNRISIVYTIAGLVPAAHVTDLDLGAPRQLQLGGSLRRAAHVARITPHPSRVVPLRRLAA